MPPSAAAQSEHSVVRVGVYQNAPQVFIDQKGQAQGIYVDILNEVAKLEGWTIAYIKGSFTEHLDAVKDGRLDVVTSIAATPERKTIFDFSHETIVSVWAQLYLNPNLNPKNILDLDGMNIAVMRDGLLGKKFEELCINFGITCRITPLASYDDALQAIDDGKADGAVVNSILGFTKESNYKSVRSSIMFSPVPLQVAVPKGKNGDIVAALDHHLAQWRADKSSIYYQIIDRWLGLKPEETFTMPNWLKWLLGGGLAVLAIFSLWNISLRNEITHRKNEKKNLAKHEKTLQRERNLFRSTVESLPGVFYLISPDLRFENWNDNFEKVSGYTKAEINTMSPLDLFEGVDKQRIAQRIKFVMEQGDASVEATLIAKDGSRHDYFFQASQVEIDGTNHLIGTGIDIRDRKQAEAALAVAKEEAENANRAKTGFLAAMSHELRTPLNSIIGFAEMMHYEVKGPLSEDYKEYTSLITRSGQLLLETINSVLDIAKIEAGKFELNIAPTFTGTIVNEILALLSVQAQAKGLKLENDTHNMHSILVDPLRIKQVIVNIVGNAIKFTDEGSITITNRCDATGHNIIISDTGIGMTEEEIKIALQPFRQVHGSALARRFQGTGLGLSYAQSVMELHGGELIMTSVPSIGTTVTLHFPPEAGEEYAI